jgi:hypothetical protein
VCQLENSQIKNECFWLGAIIFAFAIYAVTPDYAAQCNAFRSVHIVNSTSKYENPSHTVAIEYPDSWKILTADDKSSCCRLQRTTKKCEE